MSTFPQPSIPKPSFPQTSPIPQPVPAAAGSAAGNAPGDPAIQPHVPFLRQPKVMVVLPLATAVVAHLALIIIVVVFSQVINSVVKAVKEQIIVPDAAMVNDAPVGGIQNPGLSGDPNRAAAQDKVEAADSSGLNDKKSESLSQSLMGGAADSATDNVISLGAHAGIGAGSSAGAALGANSGLGAADTGSLSPFGVPGGGGGTGPQSPFMGISGNGRRVVYLVDGSGSMLTVFPRVKQELMTSISHLQPVQAFNIIVFHLDESDMQTMSKGGLLMANPDNKIAAGKFTDVQGAMGGTDPVPAIKLAFRQKPDLIYVLTDGFDNVDSFQAIVDLFRTSNTGHAKVNAIMLKSRDDPELEHVLKAITDDGHGIFKVIDEKDF
jgi:hypothetical protein